MSQEGLQNWNNCLVRKEESEYRVRWGRRRQSKRQAEKEKEKEEEDEEDMKKYFYLRRQKWGYPDC